MVKCQSKLIVRGVVAYTIGSTEPSPYKKEVNFYLNRMIFFFILLPSLSIICNKCVCFFFLRCNSVER